MISREYLKRAQICLRLAQETADRARAAKLRNLAAEYRRKALDSFPEKNAGAQHVRRVDHALLRD
jgi:hypothetical protein